MKKNNQGNMEEGSNLVVIQPDVFEYFPDSASVNEALRLLIEIFKKMEASQSRRKKSAAKSVTTETESESKLLP